MRYQAITASFLALIALSACDAPDGWEWQEQLYDKIPYTDSRTAGYGVSYVLVKMAPSAGPVLRPELPDVKEIIQEIPKEEVIIEKYRDAEPVFDKDLNPKK